MIVRKTVLPIITLLSTILVHGQIPTEVPKPQDNKPVDFTDPVEIVVFILLPLIMIVLFIIWSKKKRRDAADSEEKNK